MSSEAEVPSVHLQFIAVIITQTDLIKGHYNITLMNMSSGSSRNAPGKDLTLLIIIQEGAVFTAATDRRTLPTAFQMCYRTIVKARDSLTDDVKITALKNMKGNNGNAQAQHQCHHRFTLDTYQVTGHYSTALRSLIQIHFDTDDQILILQLLNKCSTLLLEKSG